MDQHGAEHDEEHDEEHGEEEEGDEYEAAPEPAPPPRRTMRRTAASSNPLRPLSPFGAIPERATHFSLSRLGASGRYDACEAASADGSIMLREWPLAELSPERIREKFGPGDYRLQWIGTSERGGRAAVGKSRSFGIPAAPPPPAPAAAPPPPAQGPMLPPEFQQTFALMSMFEQMQANKLAQLGQMAAMLGGQSRGPDSTVLEMMRDMMREQREASERQTQLILRALSDGDDDDTPQPPQAPASSGALAPVFKPGEPVSESLKATALNWAASNPEQAAALAKQVLETVSKIAGAVSGPAPRARAAAATVVRREPPILVEQKTPEPAHVNGAPPVSTNDPYVSAARAAQPASSS